MLEWQNQEAVAATGILLELCEGIRNRGLRAELALEAALGLETDEASSRLGKLCCFCFFL